MQEPSFYYLVEQNINDLIKNKHNCYNSISRVKLLCTILCGSLSVYKVNKQTNQYENLIDIYGKQESIDENVQLIKSQMICFQTNKSLKIYFFNIVRISDQEKQKEFPSAFEEKCEDGQTHKFVAKYSKNISLLTLKSIRENKRKQYQFNDIKGSSYEQFIGKKYEDLGYSVIYHGIEQKFNDQGIDLIAQKDNNIIFVQCKNWIGRKFNKLFRKDLQAFAGDCFLFMHKPNTYNINFDGQQVSLHFIVNKDELLDNSAKSFLKYNPFIKFKIIEFSE